eukprot:IDg3497t1
MASGIQERKATRSVMNMIVISASYSETNSTLMYAELGSHVLSTADWH